MEFFHCFDLSSINTMGMKPLFKPLWYQLEWAEVWLKWNIGQ